MIYIFHRQHNGKPVFYPVSLRNDDEAIANALANPGTTKVADSENRVVWSADRATH